MYAGTNYDKFFAELTMWYFDSRGDYGRLDPKPKPGREWLKGYDPDAFALVDNVYSGRVKVERVERKSLEPRPAADEGKLRSEKSEKASEITFDNRTAGDLELYWLDFNGKRQPYGKVAAGKKESRETFQSHPWLVAKPDGTVVGIFVPTAGRVRAVLK